MIRGLSCCILLIALNSVAAKGSNNFRWYCDIQDEPVQELQWNAQSNTFITLDDGEEMSSAGKEGTRNLEALQEYNPSSYLRGDVPDHEQAISAVSRKTLVNRGAEAEDDPDSEVVLVRRCSCWNPVGLQSTDFYCPLARTHCGLSVGWTAPEGFSSVSTVVYNDPGCLDVKRQRSFARNVWPIVTVW